MRTVIAGGHGQIALILERLLSARGDSVAGFIRNPAQAGDLADAGAEALVVDLEKASVDEVAGHLRAQTPSSSPQAQARAAVPHARTPSTATRRFCWPTRPKQRESSGT